MALSLCLLAIFSVGLQSSTGMAITDEQSCLVVTIDNNVDFSPRQEEVSRLIIFEKDAPELRDAKRTIYVYLPPDYYQTEKRYPVIYLQDGGMLFSTSERDVHYDQTLDQLFVSGVTNGIIAVGIAASANHRWDEYSPWVNNNLNLWVNNWDNGGGEGENYLDFIVNTLKPEIDSNYRTLPDRENTGIGGFSMGGLISIYAGLSRPEVFSKVMATSPAVWFAETGGNWLSNNQLLSYIASIEVPKNVKFYIDVGTNEWAENPVTAYDKDNNSLTYPYIWQTGAETLYNYLRAMLMPESSLLLVREPDGIHDVSSWGGRFGDAITWLYSPQFLPEAPPTPDITPVIISNTDLSHVAATTMEKAGSSTSEQVSDSLEQNQGQTNYNKILIGDSVALTGGLAVIIAGIILILLAGKKLGKK